MRSHGVPNFPDPTFSGGTTMIVLPSGLDVSSPQMQTAQKACLPELLGGGKRIHGQPVSGSGS